MPVIDSLVHVTPDGSWFGTRHDASLGRLLAEMDAGGVDRAVVVALAGHIDNGFVARTCAAHSDRLIPGASLDPSRAPSPARAAAMRRELDAEADFAVLKLHPRLNGYDPLDPRCLALLEANALCARPLPVWLDTIWRGPGAALSRAPADTVHELAARFPDTPLVLLHGGGPDLLALADMAGKFPNLTLDLSLTALYYAGSSLDADIRFALGRRDRVCVAGSDFPEYTPREYIARLRTLGRDLEPDKLDNVLGRTLARLLGLEPA